MPTNDLRLLDLLVSTTSLVDVDNADDDEGDELVPNRLYGLFSNTNVNIQTITRIANISLT